MTPDVFPVRDEATLRVDVAARSARLRRRYRLAVVAPAALLTTAAVAFGLSNRLDDEARLRVVDSSTTTAPVSNGDPTAIAATGGGGPARVVEGVLGTIATPNRSTPTTKADSGRGTTTTTTASSPQAMPAPHMVFVRNGELYEQGLDGRGLRRLASGLASSPTWSPDGASIAFAQPAPDGHRIVVLDAAGGGTRVLYESADLAATDPAWSPDGRLVAFTGTPRVQSNAPGAERAVWVVDVATAKATRVAAGRLPTWAPDGRLAFDCPDGRHLCTATVGGAVAEVPASEELSDAAWSPDGTWLAARHNTTRRLVVLRPDGTGRRELPDRTTAGPAWLPAGGRLAYPAEVATGIWSVDLDGEDRRQLTDAPNDRAPSITTKRKEH